MRNYISVLLLAFIFTGVKAQAKDATCSDFKVGKFFYSQVPGAYSVRDSSTQVSYYPDGSINKFAVNWINECEFDLIYQENLKGSSKFQKGDKIKVKIVRVSNTCFRFSSSFDSNAFPETEMCKEKE